MKNLIFIVLSAILLPEAFSQSNIRFENRKNEGYYNITQFGLLMGNQPISEQNPGYFNDRRDYQISPSVTMVNGKMYNERWAAGIGVGFEIFDRNLFPVFIDVRRTIRDSEVSPFFALKMGYSISGFKKKHYDQLSLNHEPYWASDVYFKKYGGFMLNPEMGVKIPLSENADVLFTVAYRHQRIKSIVTQKQKHVNPRKWEYKAEMNRLCFGIAFMFR